MVARDEASDDLAVADLPTLIERFRLAEGLSYKQLADRSGGAVTASRAHQLVTRPLKNFPDPPTIRGLSQAMRVPVRIVIHASARSLGLDVREPSRLAELLPPEVDDLPEAQVWAILAIVRALVESHEEQQQVIADLRARPDVDRPALEEAEDDAAAAREVGQKAAAWDRLQQSSDAAPDQELDQGASSDRR